MIQEALEYMAAVGKESADVVVKPEPEPAHVYFVRQADGSLKKMEAATSPRSHSAADLQAIVELIANSSGDPTEVWYSRGAVTLFVGESRRDRVTLPLHLSLPLQTLMHWEKHKPALAQAQLLKELRITFRECLSTAGDIVNIIRRVKLTLNSQGETELQHGKASLGRAITAEVTGAGALPEFFTLHVPIFTNPAFASASYPIECALEPDAATGTFQVIPVPNRIEKAIALGEQRVGVMLGEFLAERNLTSTPLYFGTP